MRARRLPALLALVTAIGLPRGLAAEAPTLRRVVVAGQAAPGGGAFERFGIEALPVVAPVNSRGQVAFFATILRGRASEGFFRATGTRIDTVAAQGDAAPGGGAFSGFGRHPIPALNDAGDVAFAAAVSGGKTVEGIFATTARRLKAVAVVGSAAPGIASGTFANLDAPALNDRGDVAFLATVRRGRESVEAIYLASGATLNKIVAQGDPAPAGGAFAGFGVPALNNSGALAFAAVVEGRAVPGGVFVAKAGRIRMLVGAGDETPIGGIFAKFSERVALNGAGAVAFTAALKEAPMAQAVFVIEGGRPRKVAALGDGAPGGGVFSHFGLWPVLSASGAVGFAASVDRGAAEVAAFVSDATGPVRIGAVGDALPGGGTLSSFGLYPVLALSPSGGATFATAPTATGEGVEGIFFAPPAARTR
jgi:hypothetical protein